VVTETYSTVLNTFSDIQHRTMTINSQELCSAYSPEPSQSRNSPETVKT